eukprot:1432108-Rhodomonas_salina.2
MRGRLRYKTKRAQASVAGASINRRNANRRNATRRSNRRKNDRRKDQQRAQAPSVRTCVSDLRLTKSDPRFPPPPLASYSMLPFLFFPVLLPPQIFWYRERVRFPSPIQRGRVRTCGVLHHPTARNYERVLQY